MSADETDWAALGSEQVESCHGKVADRNLDLRLLDPYSEGEIPNAWQ
jgi:hypothetical protein